MAKTTRWMTWVLDEAQKSDTPLPFARQERSASMIAEKLHKAS